MNEWATMRAIKDATTVWVKAIIIVVIGLSIARYTGLEQWAYEQGKSHRAWFESQR